MTKNLEVLETWFQRVWNEGDASAIDEMFQEQGKARGLGGQDDSAEIDVEGGIAEQVRVGPAGFKGFHQSFFQMMDKFDIRVNQSMEQDDWISALCSVKATCKTSGKRVGMTGSVLVRVADGQIAEAYNHWDFMTIYQQLGLLPESAFERCLGGEKVA